MAAEKVIPKALLPSSGKFYNLVNSSYVSIFVLMGFLIHKFMLFPVLFVTYVH